MYFSAYGLTIKSDIDLLIPSLENESPPDVTIHFGEITTPLKKYTWDHVWYSYDSIDQLVLKWDIIGTFLIKSGSEVLISPNDPARHENIRQPILGTILAMILQQRGCFVLHGSAVLMDGKVVIFTGSKGQGKSTLASWLNKGGYPLLSDDICAIDFEDGNALSIRPAFPKIKLSPEALIHLGENPEQYPRVHPEHQKRTKDMGQGFCKTAQSVGAICTLETGDELKLEQLHGMDAVKEILTHMLINRFPEDQPPELSQKIFLYSTQVSMALPVYRLTRPRDLEKLPATTTIIKQLQKW